MMKNSSIGTGTSDARPVGYRGYNELSKQWYYSEEEKTLRSFAIVEKVYPEAVVDQRDALIHAITAVMTPDQLDEPILTLGGMSPRQLLLKIHAVPAL